MIILLNSLIILAAYFLDTAKIFSFLSVFGISPDFILITILCFCMYYGKERGLVLSVLIGLLVDIVSGAALGTNALLFLAASVICAVTYETIFERNIWTALVTVGLLSIVFNTVTYVFQIFMTGGYNFFYCLIRYILPGCIYNIIITPIIYWIVGKVYYRNERIF